MTSLLVGLALVAGAPNLKDKPKNDPTIVGEWAVESVSTNGNPGGIAKGLRYTFTTDGKWLIQRDGQDLPLANGTRTFTQDPKPNPPAVDLITERVGGPGGTRLVGIFKVEGDMLTICGTRTKGAERPKTFDPGAGITIYTLKRVKKE